MTPMTARPCACGQKLLWARTERGKWIPLNPKPDPEGNQAAWQDSDGTWKTRQVGPASDPPWDYERVFMPHFATCERRKTAGGAGAPSTPAPPASNVIPASTFLAKLRDRQTRR